VQSPVWSNPSECRRIQVSKLLGGTSSSPMRIPGGDLQETLSEMPPATLIQNTGIYIFRSRVSITIRRHVPFDIGARPFPRLTAVASAPFYALPMDFELFKKFNIFKVTSASARLLAGASAAMRCSAMFARCRSETGSAAWDLRGPERGRRTGIRLIRDAAPPPVYVGGIEPD